jgi:homoserine O-acetyltransferase
MTDDSRFGLARSVTLAGPLQLDGGTRFAPVEIAYET